MEILENLNLKMKELENKQIIRLNQEYKEMFNSFINKDDYTNIEALKDYQFKHKISKQEFDRRNELYKKLIEEKIKEVEKGKITYQEFFKIKKEINAKYIK